MWIMESAAINTTPELLKHIISEDFDKTLTDITSNSNTHHY